jgi:hypothetical protein
MRKYTVGQRLMFTPSRQDDGLSRLMPHGPVTVWRLHPTVVNGEPIYEVVARNGEVYCAYEHELSDELTGASRALFMAGAALALIAAIGIAGWIEGLS